jgi:hypothetical protein
MQNTIEGYSRPKLRTAASITMTAGEVNLLLGSKTWSLSFDMSEQDAVGRVFDMLQKGAPVGELIASNMSIADELTTLLHSLDEHRFLIESAQSSGHPAISGTQLYREIRRIVVRVIDKVAKSIFFNGLKSSQVAREQIIGYALEYYWIVKSAPGLIAPALAFANNPEDRALLQDFLKSELGHDRFLAKALRCAGLSDEQIESHMPLPATFALCASLGVYARQHPLSFKACLFLFEQAQPQFVDAFDQRCMELGLPEGFYLPLRAHADLNSDFDHEDITRDLMANVPLVSHEEAIVTKRHVAILAETLVAQEDQIMDYCGTSGNLNASLN